MHDRLRERFLSLWQSISAHGNSNHVFEDLVRRYAEPHLRYHTLNHIKRCLREFDRVRGLFKFPEATELAIWFHDAIYDVSVPLHINEVKSMILAHETMTKASVKGEIVKQVRVLISSSDHFARLGSFSRESDVRLFTDIDLSILGKPKRIYSAYARAIREEYAHIPLLEFSQKRIEILELLIDHRRAPLYTSVYFRKRYEVKARINIYAEIERLRRECSAVS